MPRDFPDLKDGDQLEPWHLNCIYDELRRWRRAKGTGGVTVTGADGGGDPRISGDSAPGLRFAVVGSSAIAHASSSTAPSSGSGTLVTFSGGAISTTGIAVKLWNYKTDASYKAGVTAVVAWIDTGWVLIDNAACTDLGS
jgi:hypothetical protein